MDITYLGSTCDDQNCPTAWATDHGTLLVQGDIVTDPDLLAKLRANGIPDHEAVIEIPAALVKFLPRTDT